MPSPDRMRLKTRSSQGGEHYNLAIVQSHPIQYFAPLFRRLAQQPEIDLTVFYCSRRGMEEYLDTGFGQSVKWDIPLLSGYRHKFLPNLSDHFQGAGFLSLINPGVVIQLLRNRYDAVLVHGHNSATNLLTIAVANLLGIPVLMRAETHLLLERSLAKRTARRLLMSILYRWLCDACLPIGTRNKEFYQHHGVRKSRLFMVPYTVDNNFFMESLSSFRPTDTARETLKQNWGLPTTKPVILFLGKLMPRKRAMDLLLAFQRLRMQGDDATLLFVGSGEQEELLRNHACQHNIPDVHFFGFRNQSALPQFYALADIFVIPSENEPWGLTINEAMCAALPIVATEDIGAVADLVRPGHNGLLFKKGDIDGLTAHLSWLISNSELCRQLGQNSLGIIRDWNYDAAVRGILRALQYVRRGHLRQPTGKRLSRSNNGHAPYKDADQS